MAGLNKIMIIGNVGRDPEMRYMPSGTPVTSFSVAVNRIFNTREGERREETEWFRVSAWDRLAERANQFLVKGSKVYVEGRLQSRTWTGQDGTPRFTNEIRANEIVFLDRAPGSGFGEDEGQSVGAGSGGGDMDAEDLPF